MARRDYGFLRSFASIGRDPTQFNNLRNLGYGGVLIDYSDPYLAQAVAAAQQAGIDFGFWGDPAAVGNDPVRMAQRFGALQQQYNPSLLVPDIEFIGKGYEGSPGWLWNQQAADAWQRYVGNARSAVTVMPNQKDFNYGAWGQNMEWLPQAYGANPNTDLYNPNDIVQTLIGQGVRPEMISPILGPGHIREGYGYGGSALWTIDDFMPYGRTPFPKAQGPAAQSQATGGPAAPTTSPRKVSGPRLSQSAEAIQSGGLKWGGQTYSNQADFKRYLESRGRSYSKWASEHPTAATALAGRPGKTGRS